MGEGVLGPAILPYYLMCLLIVLTSPHEQETEYKIILIGYFSFSFYPCNG
jgi:hypothetical protein